MSLSYKANFLAHLSGVYCKEKRSNCLYRIPKRKICGLWTLGLLHQSFKYRKKLYMATKCSTGFSGHDAKSIYKNMLQNSRKASFWCPKNGFLVFVKNVSNMPIWPMLTEACIKVRNSQNSSGIFSEMALDVFACLDGSRGQTSCSFFFIFVLVAWTSSFSFAFLSFCLYCNTGGACELSSPFRLRVHGRRAGVHRILFYLRSFLRPCHLGSLGEDQLKELVILILLFIFFQHQLNVTCSSMTYSTSE